MFLLEVGPHTDGVERRREWAMRWVVA